MLLALDNLQWCDQETLAFVVFCLGLAPGAPVLVAATLRDDNLDEDPALADWTVRLRAAGLLSEISLGPLDVAGTARLAEAVSGRPLPAADADLLQATTGGFPLYVIESVRAPADPGGARPPAGDLTAAAPAAPAGPGSARAGCGGRPGRPGSPRPAGDLTAAAPAGPGGARPPAGDLTAVLRNRLGQVSAAAGEVAALAAAAGRDFSLDLLTEASDLDADTVVRAVDELWRRRIIREFGDGYDFSHDLLRETAYAQVSPPKRWLLHRRVAQGLELLHAGDPDLVAAQLAEQYARGGRPGRAVAYYLRAADAAAGMFAHAEAIRLHQQALSSTRDLPAGRDPHRQELAVLEAMAAPLTARHGYSSPELQRALERSITLAETLGRKDSTLTALVALWSSRFVQGRTADGHQIATRALSLAGPGSDLSAPAHFAVGGSAVSLGMPADALHHLELAAKLASGALSLSVGTRPDVHATAWAAHAHWLVGHDQDAQASRHDAIKLARVIGHPYSLAVALAYGAITHQIRHDLAALTGAVAELRDLCDRHGFAYYREWALVLDGWSRAGEPGIDLARRGISNLKSQGSFAPMPYWLSLLADLLARAGQPAAARAALDAALAAGQAHDDLWWLPEVMRMRAAHDDDPAAAITRLRSAAQMASAHGSLALLRRCQHDLAQRDART